MNNENKNLSDEELEEKETKKNNLMIIGFLFLFGFVIYFLFFDDKSNISNITNSSNNTDYEDDVNWNNYSYEVKIRIDNYSNNCNCIGLQNEFNTAYENSDRQSKRVGENNFRLLGYIDNKIQKCGCR